MQCCYAGGSLFQTHENPEHLAMMQVVLGAIPKRMVKNASKQAQKMFNARTQELIWPAPGMTKRNIRAVEKLTNLTDLLRDCGEPSVRPHVEVGAALARS